jgi:hypothetical protein
LVERGFKRRTGGLYTKAAVPGIELVVGLGSASQGYPKDHCAIWPTVGVRHLEVEKLRAAFTGGPGGVLFTVSTGLGYTMPANKWRTWEFGPETAYSAAAEVLAAIDEFGIPYAEGLCTLESILPLVLGEQIYETTAPVVLLVLGRVDEANALIDRLLAKAEGQSGPWAEMVRSYASKARAHQP